MSWDDGMQAAVAALAPALLRDYEHHRRIRKAMPDAARREALCHLRSMLDRVEERLIAELHQAMRCEQED